MSRWTPRTCCCASSWAFAVRMRRSGRRRGSAPSSAPTARGPTSMAVPVELSTTIEAYWALRLAGDPADAEHMLAAAGFIRAQGGLQRARVFTHVWLALFGLWSWERVPALPPEVVLLPSWVPLNVYDFACWARQTIVALSLVKAHRPARKLPFDLDELNVAEPVVRTRPSRRGRLAEPPGPVAAGIRAPPDRPPANPRARPRRALDRTTPGGRRLVGRDPAPVGVLAHGAASQRLSAGSPRDAPGPRGPRALHGRGSRRLARGGRPGRPQPPPGSVPVARVGHGAGDDRPQRRRPAGGSPRARAGGRVAAR